MSRDSLFAASFEDAPVAPERCPAIGDVGAVQPQMDRGNVAPFSLFGVALVAWALLAFDIAVAWRLW